MGVPEGTWSHSGRCLELSYNSTGPWHSEINPQWGDIGNCTLDQSSWPCHGWRWPMTVARCMCHCRLHTCTNTHYWLGQSPERGPNVEHSIGLAEGTEEHRFEGTSGRIHLQWRRPADLMELAEFHNSSGSLILALNAQRWDWRSSTFCGP